VVDRVGTTAYPLSRRVLIYKRTHTGDPDGTGQFGIHDCMGGVRNRHFGAVIGIGGISAEPISQRIDGRLTWVGIGPHRLPGDGRKGPIIVFDHFLLLERKGPNLAGLAPRLARHMYVTNRRHVMSDTLAEPLQLEVRAILALALRAPPSPVRGNTGAATVLGTRRCMTKSPRRPFPHTERRKSTRHC
jgi:hypothetical protein